MGNDRRKKFLVVLSASFGGSERISLFISKYLVELGYDVKLIVIKEDAVKEMPFYLNMGIDYEIVRWRFLLPRLLKVIIYERPYGVFSSLFPFNIRLCKIKRFFPFFRLIVRNNIGLSEVDNNTLNQIKRLYRYTDKIILQTEEMKDEFKSAFENKNICVVPNPIDTEFIDECLKAPNPYADENRKVLVAVGRFSDQKNYELLIESFKLLNEDVNDTVLYIVGSIAGAYTSYYHKIVKLIKESEIESKIKIVGFKDNPYVYIKYAQCFVLSSKFEGYPNVINEALYCGTPIAAVNCTPIIGRIVKEGVYGYVVDKSDPIALSSAINMAMRLERYKCKVNERSKEELKKIFI